MEISSTETSHPSRQSPGFVIVTSGQPHLHLSHSTLSLDLHSTKVPISIQHPDPTRPLSYPSTYAIASLRYKAARFLQATPPNASTSTSRLIDRLRRITVHFLSRFSATMADSGNAPKPSSSVKLVLLGEAAVGKSSLVLRFVNNDFQENKEPTIGAAFLTQKCNLPTRTIKFEIWDTAGQERFASLAPMYYRNAQAALVVYDLTKPTSLVKAKHWVAELQRQASPGIVIALVGNKLDLTGNSSAGEADDGEDGEESGDARKVSTEEAQTYAEDESLLFFETSAKSGHNVTEVFTAIANAIPETSLKSARGPGASTAASRAAEEQRGALSCEPLFGNDAKRSIRELIFALCLKAEHELATILPVKLPYARPAVIFMVQLGCNARLWGLIAELQVYKPVLGAVLRDMAASISEAQTELISSLAPDDIPIKLRCAICSKLAINAFRLPCCEQAICETCQSNLPASCPVCEHSPLSAEDCNPNKSLRTTIRVFLRTAEKKREASRAKEEKESEPPTPIEAPRPSLPAAQVPIVQAPADVPPAGEVPTAEDASGPKEETAAESLPPANQDNVAQDTTLVQQDDSAETRAELVEGGNGEQDDDRSNELAVVVKDEDGEQAGEGQENYDSEAANGGFPNMNFSGSGDFNQMQMMMAMQNGMAPNSFGNFPMMGMGMDPMTMQNMYMNGGFQGMGMNGMNGMGGFGGGFGQGSNNNWNGSQSWNFDQNNYNQNGPGMGTGDFGNFNSGFQTGYNQGNYGQMNNYRQQNTFGRGRGRGRGSYGGYARGGYQQFGGQGNYQDQGQMSQYGSDTQSQSQGQGQGQGQPLNDSSTGQTQTGDSKDVDEYGRALRPETGDANQDAGEAHAAVDGDKDPSALASRETLGNEASGDVPHAVDAPSNRPSITPSAGNSHQRNGSNTMIRSVLAAPDVPINAPKGPKAMRQGLPNTSLLNLRARGYQVGDVPPVRPIAAVKENVAEQPPSRSSSRGGGKSGDRGSRRERSKERAKDSDRRDKEHVDGEPGDSASRSRTASRSRSRGHRGSRRRRRHRSESAEEEGYDDDHRRKKHKSRRHHYDDEEYSRLKDKDDKYSKEQDDKYVKTEDEKFIKDKDEKQLNEQDEKYIKDKDDKHTERSRSASPNDSKRSSRRSRKDRDYDKRRDRDKDSDKDKYRDDDAKTSSGHRSHRDRDHDRDYDRDRRRDKDRERDKDRKDRKDRHRERERDNRHSSSRKHSVDAADTPTDKEFKPPTGPRGFDIKGSNNRRGPAHARARSP
ncbi:hypothetical protein G7046_g6704 [Stylonectria norvegica]|nr:hypothetical protein G7046_g6704 [Stylonectria norvegica]